MRYGTWTTIDTPTKNEGNALAFLRDEFEKIGGNVYTNTNPHDFGSYPSFEVNKPIKFGDLIECEDYCGACAECDLLTNYDEWIDKANEIEKRYSEKFKKWL